MTTANLNPPLKWHGGKHYLAAKIIALMPPHTHYVEPFAGGLAVLLAKDPECVSEVVNDLNSWLTNFWRVLADDEAFAEFARRVAAHPFSEASWAWAAGVFDEWERHGRDIIKTFPRPSAVGAAAFFIRCRQSLAGRMDRFAPLSRNRVRRGMNEQASAWITAVDGLADVHARLRRVVVLNHDALEVIDQQDGPATLFYLDPPYLHQTRATTGEYAHEMTEADHRRLLMRLSGIQGKFLLSGYRSDLYDSHAAANGWVRHQFELPNNAAGGTAKRRMIECLWANFAPGAHRV
jgi:DNA adenine methylase